jgi:hypothetical protein
LGTIMKWALSLVLPPGGDASVGMSKLKSDREILISLKYPKAGTKKHVQPDVEIHRQGACLLRGHEEYRECVKRMCYPQWVDDSLAAAFLAEKEDRGKQVTLFAASIEKKGRVLVGAQCLDADEIVNLEDD